MLVDIDRCWFIAGGSDMKKFNFILVGFVSVAVFFVGCRKEGRTNPLDPLNPHYLATSAGVIAGNVYLTKLSDRSYPYSYSDHSGITVTIVSKIDNSNTVSTLTDSAGRFRFEGVLLGKYDCSATKTGFSTQNIGSSDALYSYLEVTYAGQIVEIAEWSRLYLADGMFTGTFYNMDNQPIVGLQVSNYIKEGGSPSYTLYTHIDTNGSGVFTLNTAVVGANQIWLNSDVYCSSSTSSSIEFTVNSGQTANLGIIKLYRKAITSNVETGTNILVDSTYYLAQSFVANTSVIRAYRFWGGGTGTVEIRTDNGGLPSSTVLSSFGWGGNYPIPIGSDISVTVNSTYWLVFKGGSMNQACGSGNPYSNGITKYSNDSGATWTALPTGISSLTDYDAAFVLYY